jgi:hypothetical protein
VSDKRLSNPFLNYRPEGARDVCRHVYKGLKKRQACKPLLGRPKKMKNCNSDEAVFPNRPRRLYIHYCICQYVLLPVLKNL